MNRSTLVRKKSKIETIVDKMTVHIVWKRALSPLSFIAFFK